MEKFIPSLNPANSNLSVISVAENAYALIADEIPKNNSAFFVGKDGVVVVDSLISRSRANEIIDCIREVTDKPIKYLINTNFHGDHTFGNCFFPDSCQIISHANSLQLMLDFNQEKKLMLKAVGGDDSLFEGVTWRLPDITFNEYFMVDIGDKTIELYFFGKGNSAGDIVVYDGQTKTVCTGNLVLGQGLIPYVIDGDIRSYAQTLFSLKESLEIEVVVPGHGSVCDKNEIDRQLKYIEFLKQGQNYDDNEDVINSGFDYFKKIKSDNDESNILDLIKRIHSSNVEGVSKVQQNKL